MRLERMAMICSSSSGTTIISSGVFSHTSKQQSDCNNCLSGSLLKSVRKDEVTHPVETGFQRIVLVMVGGSQMGATW